MKCPVCEKEGLPANSTKCPQCDSDFSHYVALENFEVKQRIRWKRRIIASFLLSSIVIGGTILMYSKSSDNGEGEFTKILRDSVYLLSALNSKYIYTIDSLKNMESPSHFNYRIKRGDNTYSILKKFSLSNKMIVDVMRLNNITDPNHIFEGQVLKIPVK